MPSRSPTHRTIAINLSPNINTIKPTSITPNPKYLCHVKGRTGIWIKPKASIAMPAANWPMMTKNTMFTKPIFGASSTVENTNAAPIAPPIHRQSIATKAVMASPPSPIPNWPDAAWPHPSTAYPPKKTKKPPPQAARPIHAPSVHWSLPVSPHLHQLQMPSANKYTA